MIAATLALLQNIQAFSFSTIRLWACSSAPPFDSYYPVHEALARLRAWQPPEKDTQRRFLANLQTIAVYHVQNNDAWTLHYPGGPVDSLLRLCPRIQRVEHMARVAPNFQSHLFPPLAPPDAPQNELKEVVTIFGTRPTLDLPNIVRASPQIELLHCQYAVRTMNQLQFNVEDPLAEGLWAPMREALAAAGKTLRDLVITTAPGERWACWGRRIRVFPKLATVLPRLGVLEKLRAEGVWLFDAEDDNQLSGFGQLLPSSITSLSLVDFWGEINGPPAQPSDFYTFGASWYRILDGVLHEVEQRRLCNLKEIILETPRFDPRELLAYRPWPLVYPEDRNVHHTSPVRSYLNRHDVLPRETERFAHRFYYGFRKLNCEFRITPLDRRARMPASSWTSLKKGE